MGLEEREQKEIEEQEKRERCIYRSQSTHIDMHIYIERDEGDDIILDDIVGT